MHHCASAIDARLSVRLWCVNRTHTRGPTLSSIFQKFGGIRPMANAVGVPPSTVMSWQKKRKIPGWRHSSILEAAARLGKDVQKADLDSIPAEADEQSAA